MNSHQYKCVDKIHNDIELNLYDKCSIYETHLIICYFGGIVSKYTAIEQRGMNSNDSIVYYGNNELFNNPYIKNRIKNKQYGKLTWTTYKKNLEIATALNGGILEEQIIKHRHCYTITVNCSYNKASKSVFWIYGIPITFHEELFYELQKCNWIHPYKIVWFTYCEDEIERNTKY